LILIIKIKTTMVVCVCKGVSDGVVRRLIDEGAGSLDELCARTGAGTDCGSCRAALAAEVIGRCRKGKELDPRAPPAGSR
jgi:bacterioferritin-associated ferredoxin